MFLTEQVYKRKMSLSLDIVKVWNLILKQQSFFNVCRYTCRRTMARVLAIVVLCVCLAAAFAADLRRLNADRAAATGPAPAKGEKGDLDTANSFGYGWGGWGGGWGGFYGGGPWGWGPWGYGYGGGYGFPYGGGWW